MFKNRPTVRVIFSKVPAPRHCGVRIPHRYRALINYERRFKGIRFTDSSQVYEGEGFHYWSATLRLIRDVLTRW